MNVIIINGSQRKNGNCERFALKAKEILERSHEVKVYTLIDLQIKYCSGCLQCEDEMECLIVDDFSKILEPNLRMADLIILASPTYFNMPSAAMVNFIDRTNKMCDYFAENEKKCLFYVVGQTDEDSIKDTYNCLHTYSEIMGMKEIMEPIISVARMPEAVSQEIVSIIEKLLL